MTRCLKQLDGTVGSPEWGADRRRSATERTESYLERIAEREKDVGAWTWLDADRAMNAARGADRRGSGGALLGLVLGVKDIFDTHDMPTGLGFAPYRDRRPAWDAACVAACRQAGAVVLGKTVTTE
ncbi:MAG TPA: amidase family protein, partial [Dongiaceae bacterium]|nr:amidase family protein [Dongiaceae bacterium]